MRKLLIESRRRPFNEQGHRPRYGGGRTRNCVGRAARRRLGRSLSIRAVDAGFMQSMRN